MKKRTVIYWLVPAAPERELFRNLIRILARQFDAPKFEPHLTLCEATDKPTARVLRGIRARPLRLRIRGISQSAKYTKTLYVRCTPNKFLRRMVSDLGGDPQSLNDPHVSLVYKRLPASTRRQLALSIKMPFREITFDSVKAVSCSTTTKTSKDVESWQVVATKKLSE